MGEDADGRWNALFSDLSGQFDAQDMREREAEQIDQVRHERGRLVLLDRFRAATGGEVRVALAGRSPLRGTVTEVGTDWIALREATWEAYLPLHAVSWVEGLPRRGRSPERAEWRTPDLRRLFREWSVDRELLSVEVGGGQLFRGVVVDVFADHVDLVVDRELTGRLVGDGAGEEARSLGIPLSALVLVRREV